MKQGNWKWVEFNQYKKKYRDKTYFKSEKSEIENLKQVKFILADTKKY